jgi:hypothetical protein
LQFIHRPLPIVLVSGLFLVGGAGVIGVAAATGSDFLPVTIFAKRFEFSSSNSDNQVPIRLVILLQTNPLRPY